VVAIGSVSRTRVAGSQLAPLGPARLIAVPARPHTAAS